jgi:hypothetical protein
MHPAQQNDLNSSVQHVEIGIDSHVKESRKSDHVGICRGGRRVGKIFDFWHNSASGYY